METPFLFCIKSCGLDIIEKVMVVLAPDDGTKADYIASHWRLLEVTIPVLRAFKSKKPLVISDG